MRARPHASLVSRGLSLASSLLVALAVALAPPAARAESLPVRKTGIARKDRALLVSVGLPDLFTPAARERLTSGFATRVLIRVYLHREGDPDAIAVAFQRVEVVYDIWDEKFRVRVTRGPGTDRAFEVATADQAIAAATALYQFPIELPIEAIPLRPGERYELAVRGDLNPLSPELMADVRRWLRQPAGAQRRPGTGGGDSFFGTFVTVFVNPQIEDSDNQVRFVSQTFGAPAP
jgi:hypothetical protein